MARYTPKRTYEWSPEIAYSVGLMASDGCLSKDGRHIDLTSVDIEQLENFSRAIGRHDKIVIKNTGSARPMGKVAYRLQFSDTAYYDFLVVVGLTPSKSKTIGRLTVPDIFYAHFLRGLFDGDGSCYGYFDKRWRSSFMFYSQFTSASLAFTTYIRSNNIRLFGVSAAAVRISPGIYTLAYAKADSAIIFKRLYENANGLSLTRKRDKFRSFIIRK